MTDSQLIHAPLHCDLAAEHRGAVAVIGNMDGVHLGHQALVRETVKAAAGRPSAAIVFEPHPRRVFQPGSPPFMLTDILQRTALLGSLGIGKVFVLPFVPDLYTQTPETFVHITLAQRLGLVGIVTGADFHFGAGRSGDSAALKRLAGDVGLEAHLVEPVLENSGEKYSSSHIRQALRDGEPEKATAMLGRPFAIRGAVSEGRRLARTLGTPTANILMGDYLRPRFGVYAITAEVDGKTYGGVANVGVRPTVDGTAEMLEAHLFDFDGDLYGSILPVHFHHFIRPEQRFEGLDALKAQIARDADTARAWLKSHL